MANIHHPDEVGLAVRVPPDDRKEALATLKQHQWDARAAVLALLRWIRADPDSALAALAPYRPAPKEHAGRGRPRRRATED